MSGEWEIKMSTHCTNTSIYDMNIQIAVTTNVNIFMLYTEIKADFQCIHKLKIKVTVIFSPHIFLIIISQIKCIAKNIFFKCGVSYGGACL